MDEIWVLLLVVLVVVIAAAIWVVLKSRVYTGGLEFEVDGEVFEGEIDHSKASIELKGLKKYADSFAKRFKAVDKMPNLSTLSKGSKGSKKPKRYHVANIWQDSPNSTSDNINFQWAHSIKNAKSALPLKRLSAIKFSNNLDTVIDYKDAGVIDIMILFALLEQVRTGLKAKNVYIHDMSIYMDT